VQRILRWIVGVPLAILVIGFAVANRRWVVLSFDPFTQTEPSVSLELPLWLLFAVGIFIGLVVGWVMSWFAQGRNRRAARDARNETASLQRELAELRRAQQPATSSQQDLTPFQGGFL
jgi:uncharacterized integral membrane protein